MRRVSHSVFVPIVQHLADADARHVDARLVQRIGLELAAAGDVCSLDEGSSAIGRVSSRGAHDGDSKPKLGLLESVQAGECPSERGMQQ